MWTSASPSVSIWPQPVYTTSVYAPAGSVGFGSFLFYSAFAYVAFRSVQSALFSRHTSTHGASHGDHDFTTIKIQVGLLSSSRWLQAQLESIAHRVDTSSQKGLHHLLQGALGWCLLLVTDCIEVEEVNGRLLRRAKDRRCVWARFSWLPL